MQRLRSRTALFLTALSAAGTLSISALIEPPSAQASQAKWQRIVLQPSTLSTQVVAADRVEPADGAAPYWLLSGATASAPPARQPIAWIVKDFAQGAVPVPMQPNDGYGQIAEVFSIAARGPDGADIAAVGQAFGGAHGNARTSTWVGNETGLSEVRTNFELYNGPRQISVRAITANNDGFVIFGSRVNQNERLGAASWHSTNGAEFTLFDNDPALSSAPNEQVQGADVITAPDGTFIAAGERLWWDPANSADTIDTDAILWRSADGRSWERFTPPSFVLGGAGEQRIQKIRYANTKLHAAGTETINGRSHVVFWGPDGTKRRIAAMGSSEDPLSAVTSLVRSNGSWYVAGRIGGTLRLTRSTDGKNWAKVKLPPTLPTGGRARLIVVPDTNSMLYIGASGLNGGGLWALPLTTG